MGNLGIRSAHEVQPADPPEESESVRLLSAPSDPCGNGQRRRADERVRLRGTTMGAQTMTDFERWFSTLGLRNFVAHEVLIGLDQGNTEPPAQLWPNIALPLIVLDALRDFFDRPVTITSAYRAPPYNASVGGTSKSQHMAFMALDFKVADTRPQMVYDILRSWRGETFVLPFKPEQWAYVAEAGPVPFKPTEIVPSDGGTFEAVYAGGLGLYNTFVHLDGRGLNHTWKGS